LGAAPLATVFLLLTAAREFVLELVCLGLKWHIFLVLVVVGWLHLVFSATLVVELVILLAARFLLLGSLLRHAIMLLLGTGWDLFFVLNLFVLPHISVLLSLHSHLLLHLLIFIISVNLAEDVLVMVWNLRACRLTRPNHAIVLMLIRIRILGRMTLSPAIASVIRLCHFNQSNLIRVNLYFDHI
jgi:hypothetical protein